MRSTRNPFANLELAIPANVSVCQPFPAITRLIYFVKKSLHSSGQYIFVTAVAMGLSACSTQKIVPSPVLVEVPGPVQYIDIPAEHLVIHNKSTYQPGLLYNEALKLWVADRSTIDVLLGQLEAIRSLNDGNSGDR